jgi:hypothetical protein
MPVHPGEILQHEFIGPMGLTQNKLALALHVPARRINEIVLGNGILIFRDFPAVTVGATDSVAPTW